MNPPCKWSFVSVNFMHSQIFFDVVVVTENEKEEKKLNLVAEFDVFAFLSYY